MYIGSSHHIPLAQQDQIVRANSKVVEAITVLLEVEKLAIQHAILELLEL